MTDRSIAKNDLLWSSQKLHELSRSFHNTGNSELGCKLSSMADLIVGAIRVLTDNNQERP